MSIILSLESAKCVRINMKKVTTMIKNNVLLWRHFAMLLLVRLSSLSVLKKTWIW